MIVVKIELWSAITHRISEIGRMYIANDGSGSAERGDYKAVVCKRGNDKIPRPLDPAGPQPTRAGAIKDYPRLAYNVWRLIARACLATFPEERAPKGVQPVLDARVMRGLQLIKEHVRSMVGDIWTDTDIQSVGASLAWLDAAKADPIEPSLPELRAALGFEDAQ